MTVGKALVRSIVNIVYCDNHSSAILRLMTCGVKVNLKA
jgi:hypothetical protein